MSFRVAGARDCALCQEGAKREGFCRISKNHGRRGAFEEDLQRCIFRGFLVFDLADRWMDGWIDG